MTTAPIGLPRAQEVSIDARVLAFGAAAAVLAALAVGLVPTWRVGRGDLESLLRRGGRIGNRGAERIRSLLLTMQVAFSVRSS